ncbi:MAG: histidine--tRNA ligase [Chloroflexi bacterium]|nr:histidine--tRNA ligase [Chloroflexota bacterium]
MRSCVFQAPRGTQDVLPEDVPYWTYVEEAARRFAVLYGYQEIRTPTFEDTELFSHGAGAATDVVEKEMYSFRDKGGKDLTLRAEGTAPVVRAYLEHGLHARPQPVRVFSLISVFRYDRPQAGRLREHHQFDCEAIGDEDPILDAEIITLLWRFFEAIGLKRLALQINSIGCPVCRPAYLERLRAHYAGFEETLCADCRRRMERNLLRLLDCKVTTCQPVADSAPAFLDYLCAACRAHFDRLKAELEAEGILSFPNHRLVRGLDYYTRTVFEVWPPQAGEQAAIGGGGRYDGLAEQIGGRPTPGVGFGTGIERLILNLRQQGVEVASSVRPAVYVAHLTDAARPAAAHFVRQLREAGVPTMAGVGVRSLRTRLRHADAAGVRWTALFGDDEVQAGTVSLRDMIAAVVETQPVAAALQRISGPASDVSA